MTLTKPVQLRLDSTSTTKRFTWFTGWMPAIAMDDAAAVLKLAGVVGNLRAQPAYQLAVARTDKPSAPVAVGSQQNADGEFHYSASDFALSGATPGNAYIRFGVAHDVSSVPNQGMAEATLQLCYHQCGSTLTPWSAHAETGMTTSKFVPISGWFASLSVANVQAIIVLSSLLGNIQVTLTYRTATASTELPGNWDSTGIGATLSANGETNSGELAVTTAGKMWIQFGLKYELSSGSTLGQVDIAALLQLRHA